MGNNPSQKKTKPSPKVGKWGFENLAIAGGGTKVIAISGALQYLEDVGVLESLQRYAGTSSGALVAAALAAGYTGLEAENLIMETDFSEFQEDQWGLLRDAKRFFQSYGWYTGKNLESFIEQVLFSKTKKRFITFRELFDLTGKILVITGTCLENKPHLRLFSNETTPNMPITVAVRASMAVPFIFEPVLYNGETFVDGGLMLNYPLQVFDVNQCTPNLQTLGLKYERSQKKKKIENFATYTLAVVNVLISDEKSLDLNRTIQVPSEIKSFNFKVSNKEKEKIREHAYYKTQKEFNNLITLRKGNPSLVVS